MRGSFSRGVVLGSATAVLVLIATSAFAGSGIGAVFNLGQKNTVNRTSVLVGSNSQPMLKVANLGGGAAMRIQVQPGAAPPFRVNSNVLVPNLNADTIDGVDSTALIQGTGSIVQARLDEPADGANRTILSVPGFGTMEASCDSNGYRLFWRNGSGTTLDTWWSVAGTTTYSSIASDAGGYPAFDTKLDQLIPLQAGYAGHTTVVTTSAHWSAGGCVFHSQSTVQ